jgi:acyl carrier protein
MMQDDAHLVEEQLLRIVSKIKHIDPEQLDISNSTDLIADLGFDSIEIAELIFYIEDQIGLQFNYEEFTEKHLRCFSELCGFVHRACRPAYG